MIRNLLVIKFKFGTTKLWDSEVTFIGELCHYVLLKNSYIIILNQLNYLIYSY